MKLKRRNNVEKVINLLLNILVFIFGVILLISIYTGIQTKILGHDYTDFFGYSIFEVQTGSMAETINPGDWIVVKLTRKVKLDDIVTYKLDGEYITHRIIEVYNGTYVTRGDANNVKDEPIDQNQIVGKVVKIFPNFGIIRRTLLNPSVLITLIITLFLFDLAFKKNKSDKKNKKTTPSKEGLGYLILNAIAKKIKLLLENAITLLNNYKKKEVKNNRNVNVSPKMDEKYLKYFEKVNSPSNNMNDEEDDEELEKTSVYRVISVDDDDVAGKFKGLVRKIENDEYKDNEENKESKTKTEKNTEDELEKTALYRVVSVDDKEVSDKYKDTSEEGGETEQPIEEDLEKTALYRVVSVDASEVNDTLLEIAKNELKGAEQKEKVSKVKEEEPKAEEKSEFEDDDSLTKINLELLKKKKGNKKSKNIIDTARFIKSEELNELIDILVDDEKLRVNKATIREKLIDSYIDAKYYNYYIDGKESNRKNSLSKIKDVIKAAADEIVNSYHKKDEKYKSIVDMYANAFMLIASLEQAKDLISELKAKKEFYRKEISKYCDDFDDEKIEYVISGILKIQRNYNGMLECLLKNLDTNMFDLKFNKLSSRKNMYGLELEHNISFSKVYSDYIIDKTYTEGIIAEDKLSVMLTMLSVQLIRDMLSANFNRKYILYVPTSLYSKEKKLQKLLRLIDDKYAKENVILLITFEDLLKNKRVVKEVRRMGYKFALAFDKETVVKAKDKGNIYIADYIFVNNEVDVMLNVLAFIPEELSDNVIYENIFNKIGDFGGE